MKIPILLVTLPLLLNVAFASTEETSALFKWKRSLSSKTQRFLPVLPSWTVYHPKTKPSPCAWFGVTCNNHGRVSRLELSSSGLNGTLQRFSFSSFPYLSYLNLSNNELHGSLPPQLSRLSELVSLDLSRNQFSGKVPSSIGVLTRLEILNLSENHLNDSMPHVIGHPKNLIQLALHNNYLQGEVPTSLRNVRKLTRLYLARNLLDCPTSSKVPGPGGR